jgi:hypothetical protein
VTESESNYGVWVRAGLVANLPWSPERGELIRRETEREAQREAQQAALDAEIRADRDLERRRSLEMQGYVPRTPFEVASAAHALWDRSDARNERQRAQLEAAAEKESWRSMRAQLAAERSRHAAERAQLLRQVTDAHAARRRAEEEAEQERRDSGYGYRTQQYFRSGGSVIGGPY